jgi:hypothetical protein
MRFLNWIRPLWSKQRDDCSLKSFSRRSIFHRMLTIWLSCAVRAEATAIVIGLPDDGPVTLEEELREQAKYSGADDEPGSWRPDPQYRLAARRSSRVISRAGLNYVPAFVKVKDIYYRHIGFPTSGLISFLTVVQERLVSLNASSDSPQPLCYIEYAHHSEPTDSVRRFVEVALIWGEDQTFWIYLLNNRVEPATVHVSKYMNG